MPKRQHKNLYKSTQQRRKHKFLALEDRFDHKISGDVGSDGLAVGQIYRFDKKLDIFAQYPIPEIQVDDEIDRFNVAVEKARGKLEVIRSAAESQSDLNSDLKSLLDVHIDMLEDSRLVRGTRKRIAADLINAEAALDAEVTYISQKFQKISDNYLTARIHDIEDIAGQILSELLPKYHNELKNLPPNTILATNFLSAAELAQLDLENVVGIACETGGINSHIAIIARSLGIPLLLDCKSLTQKIHPHQTAIIDADQGILILNPNKDLWKSYQDEIKRRKKELQQLISKDIHDAVTKDGVKISLSANVEFAFELLKVQERHLDGLGLVRSEFLYLNRTDLPSVEEQYHFFKSILQTMKGKPVAIRTLDIGSDKIAPALQNILHAEKNPALGLRGIRLSLALPALLEIQFEAMLRAAKFGTLRILLPMITSLSEVLKAKEILQKTHSRLKNENADIPEILPELGIMIETPAAALSAVDLAHHVDFFSLGTNDLIQYCLATDRDEQQVKDYYDPLHPAVITLIKMAIDGAKLANIPFSICGEMAADPDYIYLLLALGVTQFSMAPAHIHYIRDVISQIDLHDLQHDFQKLEMERPAKSYPDILDCLKSKSI